MSSFQDDPELSLGNRVNTKLKIIFIKHSFLRKIALSGEKNCLCIPLSDEAMKCYSQLILTTTLVKGLKARSEHVPFVISVATHVRSERDLWRVFGSKHPPRRAPWRCNFSPFPGRRQRRRTTRTVERTALCTGEAGEAEEGERGEEEKEKEEEGETWVSEESSANQKSPPGV